jgi:hypothetical protein
MYRKLFAALAATFVLLVGVAPVASAGPRSALTLSAVDVGVYGPSTNPVFFGCQSIHPPSSDCGYVYVTATVSGFDAYGGLSDDPSSYNQLGGFGGPGSSARLTEVYTCGTSTRVRLLSTTLAPSGIWGGYGGTTNRYTRRGSDAATLNAGFQFPNPRSTCDDLRIRAAWVSDVRLGFDGIDGAPDQVFRLRGTHRVPLPA